MKNQVYMHQHSPHTAPYSSSCDAMSKYPERCTAVGLRLNEESDFELYVPYGLEDIFEFSSSSNSSFFRESRPNGSLSNTSIQEKLAGEWKNLILKYLRKL